MDQDYLKSDSEYYLNDQSNSEEIYFLDEYDNEDPNNLLKYKLEKISLSKKKNPTVKELERIFLERGYNNNEFCNQIKLLILKLIRRYYGEPNDDLVQEIYENILLKIKYFNESKGKLASYIHTLIRNEISLYRYHKKRFDDHNIFVDNESELDTQILEPLSDIEDIREIVNILKSFKYIKFNNVNDLVHIESNFNNELLIKVLKWHKVI